MMIANKFRVVVTHIPTGITAEAGGAQYRTERTAAAAASSLLMARVAARSQSKSGNSFDYVLNDDDPHPNNLCEFRR